MTLIVHIATREAWQNAVAAGIYRVESLDTEGFIHCSTLAQVVTVADAFYRGRDDLLLLIIDETRLEATLRYEPPAHPAGHEPPPDDSGELFPHIYGPLNLDAVIRIIDFKPGAGGTFALPDVGGA